jgi:small subunit ribosomal protein S14
LARDKEEKTVARTALIEKWKAEPKFKVRKHNRCKLCGRPHAYMRKFGICRICFRKYCYQGAIPGVTKASW